MKIAFLCHDVFENGGVQRVVTSLCNELCKNYEVEIICTNSNIKVDYEKYNLNSEKIKVVFNKVKIKNAFLKKYYKIWRGLNHCTGIFNNRYMVNTLKRIYYPKIILKDIIKLINEKDYDVVVGCEGYHSVLLATIKSEVNSKLFGWQHNSVDAYFNTKNKYYWNRQQLFKQYINKLDEYIVLTKSDKEKLKNDFNIKSRVIYNPISFKANLKSNCDNKIVLAVGRFTRQKGFDNLLKAFKIMIDECNDWKLFLCGDGEDKEKLLNLADSLEINNNIEFKPFTNEVEELMRQSSIYAMSSRWEGFGLVVTEALEVGLPVVTFETTGPREIIGDSGAGIIIEMENIDAFASALIKLANDRKLRKEISKKAVERAKDFYEDNIINEWEKIIN